MKVLGTPVESIVLTEDRQKFAEQLAAVNEPVAPSKAAYSVQEVSRLSIFVVVEVFDVHTQTFLVVDSFMSAYYV